MPPSPRTLAWIKLLLDPDLDRNAPSPAPTEIARVVAELDTAAARFGPPGTPRGKFGRHLCAMQWIQHELAKLSAEWACGWKLCPRKDTKQASTVRALHGQLRELRLRVGLQGYSGRERSRRSDELEEEWIEEKRELRLIAVGELADVLAVRIKRGHPDARQPRQLFEYLRRFVFGPRIIRERELDGAYVAHLRQRLHGSGETPVGTQDGEVEPTARDERDEQAVRGDNRRGWANVFELLELFETAFQAMRDPDRSDEIECDLVRMSRARFAARALLIHLHSRCIPTIGTREPLELTATDAAYSGVLESEATTERDKTRAPHHLALSLDDEWARTRELLGSPEARAALRERLRQRDDELPLTVAIPFGAALVRSVARRRVAKGHELWPSDADSAKKLLGDAIPNYMPLARDFASKILDDIAAGDPLHATYLLFCASKDN